MSGGQPGERLEPLRASLKRAHAEGRTATLLCHLRAQGSSAIPTPEESARLAESALARASASSGLTPLRHQILRNLAAIRVEAGAAFLLDLLAQPEIHDASASDPAPGAVGVVRPVRKGPATDSGWSEPR